MKRKFSFDIPKLKIGSLRPEGSSKQQQHELHGLLISPTESRPPTPKSVRPPLPGDVDAELRAACTYIITHPKPSHEIWDRSATRPALDYASIKADVDLAPMGPVRTRSTRHKPEPSHDSSKYSYRPHIAVEDLFKSEKPLPQTSARSRADQLMAGGAAGAPSVVSRHSRSGSQQQPAPYTIGTEPHEKPRISGRSDSVGTSGSTPHTDSTDYPWSASTGLTSAAITPARSKRTSSQAVTSTSESGSVPKIEAANAEWMRVELEKHKKLIEERDRALQRANDQSMDFTPTYLPKRAPTPQAASQVPARKPVPSRPGSSQAREPSRAGTRQASRQEIRDDAQQIDRGRVKHARPESFQQGPEAENRGRLLARSSSRLGKAARSASRAALQAANKAESITNDIIGHYFRPNSDQPTQEPLERPPSRARDFASNVKEYFRPGSSTGNRSRKPSIDLNRGHRRSQSFESQRSGVAPSERSMRWRGKLFNRSRSNVALVDDDTVSPPPQQQKPPIDLNRELPPLPSLDQWKDDEPDISAQAPVERRQTPGSERPKSRTPIVEGLRRALSRKDLRRAASPKLATREDAIAACLGSPTPPMSQKQSVDTKRLTPNSLHPLPSPPPLSGSSQLSSPLANEFDLSSLSLGGGSIEPMPSNASARSGQTRSDHLRSPHIHTQQLTPEKSSRRTPHIADYSRGAGPPPSGSVRTWNRIETNSSTPFGHSRQSSNKENTARKYSMDEYSRPNDDRYQNTVEVKSTHSSEKKRHWWQGGKNRRPSQANWMDQVVKSGARNGMLMTDDAAGAPVVRY
ncbi:hypothetical protein HII31_11529 [Pseudocercospora fuligena]|uniref:Uncharacterized protein n=1 Tax=Pseudocercospora fuligena TaxID=685502 RepID=A0A8H6R9W3_9PEZI|nr:hypothetical protein HII31_11529 [Pseudocercospora fuligena]